MNSFSKISIALALLISASSTYAQLDGAEQLKRQFSDYQVKNVQEKVFVHTDKNTYLAGETLWFKAYTTDATYNLPVNTSKIVYAEVLNDEMQAVAQGMVKIRKGSGSGSFYLPFNLSSGTYRFRAYTNWMKNFGAEFYYEQPILIINPLTTAPQVIPSEAQPAYELNFFPEGGHLVNGIASRVAVKAADRNGNGVKYSGWILNQRNDTVASFQSSKFGMGRFEFTAQEGQQYRAIVSIGENKKDYTFPTVESRGYTLRAGLEAGRLKVEVRSSGVESGRVIYLLVHARNTLKAIQAQGTQSGGNTFYFEQPQLGEGIVTITLLNGERQPVCERLVFFQPAKQLSLSTSVNAASYAPRSAGTVDINIVDRTGKKAEADISIGIHLADSLDRVQVPSILSYLWLSSDLRGYIESSEYYFSEKTEELTLAADNLMLTQGWRRFSWDDLLRSKDGPAFSFLPEYEGHVVMGNVIDRKAGQPAAGIAVYLSSVGTKNNFGLTRTNKNGRFSTVLNRMYGNGEVIVQADPKANGDYQLNVASPYSSSNSDRRFPLYSISPDLAGSILASGIESQAQNLYYPERIKKVAVPDNTDSSSFFGKPDGTYYLDKYTRFRTMEEVMREYVAGVAVRKQGGKFQMRVNDQPHAKYFGSNPLVLIDEVPIFDMDKLMAYDPLKIGKVEVMNRRYLYNDVVMDGIVSYKTYEGNMPGFKIDPTALVVAYDGIQAKREFYTPSYPSGSANRLPDFRNQLSWVTDLKPNAAGHYILPFTSSDIEGRFIGTIQGIGKDGGCVVGYFYFDVRK